VNIIVLIIDTLRYDYIGAHGNEWMRTPNMDALAARSWVFDYSFCSSYPTIPHRTEVITGRYGRPFHRWQPLPFHVPTLPGILAEAGYCTQLIHDTPHLVNGGHAFDYPFHAWTFCRGAEVDRPWIDAHLAWPENWAPDPLFDLADDDALANRTVTTYARANRKRARHEDWNTAKLFLTACEWLRDNASRDNFFLWLDCFDPHEPWDVPPEFITTYDRRAGYDGRIDPRSFVVRNDPNLPAAARQHVAAQYAAKVSWVDRWLGEVLNALETTGLIENTALLLTADHGTNVGERGRFGKGQPVREQEAHTPFMLYVPDGGSGRSDAIVQPQDVFATVLGLAGLPLPVPEGIESYDVLSVARQGGDGQRAWAVAGGAAGAWPQRAEGILYTVFNQEWYLQVAARPERCLLTRLGSLEDVTSEHPAVVGEMYDAGLRELERRGTDPRLMAWLRGQGEGAFPGDCRLWDFQPSPPGWQTYFNQLYTQEVAVLSPGQFG
jgi:arylsulfatase A-like enzyme